MNQDYVEHQNLVKKYYKETAWDFKYVWDWKKSGHPSVHFGIYDSEASNHQEAVINTIQQMALAAGVKRGDTVLDAGCGRGGASFWLAEKLKAKPTGINISKNQLEECRTENTKRNLSIEFIESDFCNTPFKDNSFDVVWACESSCHSPRKFDFYKESFRVLKPGGTIVIGDCVRSSRTLHSGDEALLQSWLSNIFCELDTEEEHKDNLSKNGFTDFHMKKYVREIYPSVKNAYNHFKKFGAIGKALSGLGIISKLRYQNAFAAGQQYKALQSGLWYYSIFTARKQA